MGFELRDWQREALDSWISSGRHGVVEAVTGTGKTAVGVAAVRSAVSRGQQALVVVPTLALLEQWHGALVDAMSGIAVDRLGGGQIPGGRAPVLVSTINSAVSHDVAGSRRGLIVADEVHRYGAEQFSRALGAGFDERLGLTATFERNDDGIENHLTPYFGRVIKGCDYERGYRDQILAPVRVMLVGVSLLDDELGTYSTADETIKKERKRLCSGLGIGADDIVTFSKHVNVLAADTGRGDWMSISARRYLGAFAKRREVLSAAMGKQLVLGDFSEVLARAGRTLVFTETKESASDCAMVLRDGGVAAEPYTSALSNGDRSDLLARFKDGRVSALVAPRVLDEGVDVPEADVGIIVASSKTRRQMIQRMGRVIRPKADGRPATFVVLYARGTYEDPAQGAHQTFLEQLTGVAAEVTTADEDTAITEFSGWMRSAAIMTDGASGVLDPELLPPEEGTADPVIEVDWSALAALVQSPLHADRVIALLSVLSPDEAIVAGQFLGIGRAVRATREEAALDVEADVDYVGTLEASIAAKFRAVGLD